MYGMVLQDTWLFEGTVWRILHMVEVMLQRVKLSVLQKLPMLMVL